MKTFIAVCVGLICFFSYKILTQEHASPIEDEELKRVLKTESYRTRSLTSSFERILPKVKGNWMKQLEPTPSLVMLGQDESAPMEPEDAIERVDQMLTNNPEEAIGFLRWSLFLSEFSSADKELIFEKAVTKLSAPELRNISQDLMNKQVEPSLYEKALVLYTRGMSPQQTQEFLKNQWPRTTEPNLQSILTGFADEKGLSIR